jgi:hypothetical protein
VRREVLRISLRAGLELLRDFLVPRQIKGRKQVENLKETGRKGKEREGKGRKKRLKKVVDTIAWRVSRPRSNSIQ